MYVEPYGGAASVLLAKKRSYAEIYNDMDGEIVNFFRVLREHGNQLRQKLELTPFARDEFMEAYEPKEISHPELLKKYHFLRCRVYYLSGDYEGVLKYLKNVTDFEGKYGEQIRVYQLDCLYRLFLIEDFSALLKDLKQEFVQQAANTLNVKSQKPSISTLLSRFQKIPEDEITEEQKHYLYLLLKLESIEANHFINTGYYQKALKSLLSRVTSFI